MSILAGEITIAEAARRNKTSQGVDRHGQQQFIEAGKLGLDAGGSALRSGREQTLEAGVADFFELRGSPWPNRLDAV